MMKSIVIWGAVLCAAALCVSAADAQAVFYRQDGRVYGPSAMPPYGYYPGGAMVRVAPRGPLPYPASPFFYKWEDHKRWLEWDQTIRSPLNPESDLDYMMRSF
jgi:hypothetical protein